MHAAQIWKALRQSASELSFVASVTNDASFLAPRKQFLGTEPRSAWKQGFWTQEDGSQPSFGEDTMMSFAAPSPGSS